MTKELEAGDCEKCPHCGVGVRFEEPPTEWPRGGFNDKIGEEDRYFRIASVVCPLCQRPIVVLEQYKQYASHAYFEFRRLIWPRSSTRPGVPPEVPVQVRRDYEEAANVLPESQKASAALSRRCLQNLLKEAAGTKSKDLADQIVEVLPSLPGYLQQQLDAVRNIGNFAAHPIKSRSTGEIVEVEAGEADWNLEVLEMLFDFYYVQPRIAREKREALDRKLTDAGKPPMK